MLRLRDLNLGKLEIAVLECLWRIGSGDAKQVHAELQMGRSPMLNTVQSALDRLFRKDILGRQKVSHAFIYHTRIQRPELVGRAISAVVNMTGAGGGELLTAFVDVVARAHPAELDALERLLAERIATARASG